MFRRLIEAIALTTIVGGPLGAAQAPPKPETDIDRVQAALDRGDPVGALVWFERLDAGSPQRRDLLTRIVALRARQLTSDSDLRVVVEACRLQLAAGSSGCLTDMRRIADDDGAETGARLAAASALVEGRAPGAEAGFQTLLGIAVGNHPAAAAGALIHRPSATSVQSLVLLAGNADRDAKYIATSALARLGAKEALPVLKSVAADREGGAERLVAHIGLAAAGDAESLRVLNETLPLLTGRDLLEAGRALVRLKDPRGPSIVRTIAEGNDEILRIEAAEVLHESQPALAANLIRTGSQSDNPWVRARALEAAAALRIVPTLSMRRAMLDSNSWVAIRAVQAITAGEPEPLRPARPRPLKPVR